MKVGFDNLAEVQGRSMINGHEFGSYYRVGDIGYWGYSLNNLDRNNIFLVFKHDQPSVKSSLLECL